MSYKIMIIDDAPEQRKPIYRKVFSNRHDDVFDPVYVWTHEDFLDQRGAPVDAYVIDVFLQNGDWRHTKTVANLLEEIGNAPRLSPIFLISERWGDTDVLSVLKQLGDSSARVVQYLAWSEFEAAAEDGSEAQPRMEALLDKVHFELNRWHGRSNFSPNPDENITVLVLSDPQFGDPDTDNSSTFDDHAIAHLLRRENRIPHIVVIAGDLTHSGRPDQYKLAEERITKDLMGPLWGEAFIDEYRERILVVPGNHDANFRFSACDGLYFNPETQCFESDAFPVDNDPCHDDYTFEPFRRFALSLTNDRKWINANSFSWVDRRFLNWGIQFFLLNSVSCLTAKTPQNYVLNEEELRLIGRSLSGDESADVFNIAISHHGVPSPDVDASERNKAGISNWKKSQGFFKNQEIGLWLFGHNHDFNCHSINSEPFSEMPLWLMQCPTLRIGKSTRGFCVLELSRKGGKVVDANIRHYAIKNSVPSFCKECKVGPQ
jgi:hypothetical protein